MPARNPQAKQIDGLLAGRQGYIHGLVPRWMTVDVVDIDPGFAVAYNDPGVVIEVGSTLSPSLAASGANGLDTGSRAIDTWYNLHVCQGSSGVAGLWSTSRNSPTLPAGYDDGFRWVGAFFNADDGFSGELRNIVHVEGIGVDRWFFLHDPEIDAKALTGGTATTWTDIDLSAYCPPGCRVARIIPHVQSPMFGPVCYFRMDGSIPDKGQTAVGISGQEMGMPIDILLDSEVVEYRLSVAPSSVDVYVLAYLLQIGVL